MTIASTARKAGPLLGTGAQTSFPFTFKVFADGDLLVTRADALGLETALALDVDYTVTLNSNQETSPGGAVVLLTAPAVGEKLTIVGDVDYDQPLDLPSGGNFSPLALENQLDRLAMQIQQLREIASRALLAPVTSSASGQLPAPQANTIIGWDVTESALQNIPIADLVTTAAYGTFRNDTFTGNGVTMVFALSNDPVVLSNLTVSVDGLTLVPGTDYGLASASLIFGVAPSVGAEILARFGQAIPSTGTLASVVEFSPAGNLASTNVQAALAELDTEKAKAGANADITSLGSLASINGAQLAGMRNLLINGNLAINQRGYVSGTATSGANQYTLDRWRVVTSGQSLVFTASGNGNSMTAPAGGVEQVIEGANIGGGTYVLGWTGTATATVNGTARAKGATFTLPANTDATVRLIGGTASLVQLEPGGTVTPFEHRSIGLELALCQRYFEVCHTGFSLLLSARAGTAFSTAVNGEYTFVTSKRATPFISGATFSNASGQAVDISPDFVRFTATATGSSPSVAAGFWATAEL